MEAHKPVEAILQSLRAPVDSEIRALLADRVEIALYEMVRYHLGLDGESQAAQTGKRVRAAMCMLCCAAVGGDAAAAAPAAAAIELLHAFTLLHDDIVDEDETRRGRPTVWCRWGVGQALTAGDALYALANLAAMRLAQHGAGEKVVAGVLAELNAATLTVCEGQHLDISYEGRNDVSVEHYLDMIGRKTAALFAASCAIGARVGGASEPAREGLRRFGREVGLAFQIVDDVLGVWGEATALGKPIGSDLRRNKRSLPIAYALSAADDDERQAISSQLAAGISRDEEAAKLAERMAQLGSREYSETRAREALARGLGALEEAAQGPAAADLSVVARYLVERTR